MANRWHGKYHYKIKLQTQKSHTHNGLLLTALYSNGWVFPCTVPSSNQGKQNIRLHKQMLTVGNANHKSITYQ